MNVVAIVQARMGSQRLPGKVLHDIAGASMLARVIERIRLAGSCITEIVIATSNLPADAPILAEARRLGVTAFAGAHDDVLARYREAARSVDAGAIVRVTADCPLLAPEVLRAVVHALTRDVDYASNTHTRSYPRGLDVEVFHRDTLERIHRLGTSSAAREHVTAYVLEQPQLFRTRQVTSAQDDSDLRWTVDTTEDLQLVRTLYERFGLATCARPYSELVAGVRAEPSLMLHNAHVQQKPTWEHTNAR